MREQEEEDKAETDGTADVAVDVGSQLELRVDQPDDAAWQGLADD